MKPTVQFGLALAALAITMQASPAMARFGGLFGGTGHGPTWHNSENGFGSRTPVTLPADRHPPAGKSTGIPITKTPSSVLINAQPKYFRPR